MEVDVSYEEAELEKRARAPKKLLSGASAKHPPRSDASAKGEWSRLKSTSTPFQRSLCAGSWMAGHRWNHIAAEEGGLIAEGTLQ